jgi:lysophospholipase L1-like esterase
MKFVQTGLLRQGDTFNARETLKVATRLETRQSMTRSGLLFLLALLVAELSGATSSTPVARIPEGVQRVVFLGDSITHSGSYVALVESYLITRHPSQRFEFINLGLSSETVSGLSEDRHAGGKFPRPDLAERLARILVQTKPDLVFACYGMNDGIYLPLDEARFAAFRRGMQHLHDSAIGAGAKIIHLTPPVFDEIHGKHPGYAAVLDGYSEWLMSQRAARGWTVFDVHAEMRAELTARRRSDPKFTFSKDSIHPDEAGHIIIARAVLKGLGARDLDQAIDAAGLLAGHAHGGEILRIVRERQGVMKFAWLSATGHKRPGVNAGLPLTDARVQAAKWDVELDRLR